MLTIFVAGNPLLKIDSLPLRILNSLSKELPQVKFEEFEPTENFPETKNIIILDTVVGLKKVEILNKIEDFSLTKAISLHDFDIGLNLKLMVKIGKIKSFKIIGVPPNLSEKEAIKQVTRIIRATLL